MVIKCEECGKQFERVNKEVRRNQRLGRKQFCTRGCASRHTAKSSWTEERRAAQAKVAKQVLDPYVKRDEFTPFRWYAAGIARRCRERKRKDGGITLQELKNVWERQQGVCPYTGVQLILPNSSEGWGEEHPPPLYMASVDRIDSAGPYSQENIQFVSTMANMAKSVYTQDDMVAFCQSIANHWSKV